MLGYRTPAEVAEDLAINEDSTKSYVVLMKGAGQY
jgi:hypothetical protein